MGIKIMVKVVTMVEVDADTWVQTYGIAAETVRGDAARHLEYTVNDTVGDALKAMANGAHVVGTVASS